GTFSVSQMLATIICIIAFYCALVIKNRVANAPLKYIASVAPMLLLSFALYAYQIFNKGEVSYYFGKTLGITLLIAGVFFIPMFIWSITQLGKRAIKIPNVWLAIVGVSLISILVVGTNQPTDAINRLTQQHSK